MAFIPIPNGIQLCFLFTTAGSNWQFCFNLRKVSGAPTSTDLTNVAQEGADWWAATFNEMVSPSTTLRETVATDMTTQGAPQARINVGTAGSASTTALPLGSALVVSLRTALRGRSYRGRIYVSGIPEGNQTDVNFVNTSYAGLMVTKVQTLFTDLTSAGYQPVVASKQHNGVVTNPAATNNITTIVVETALDSQRRRLAGRGD